MKKGSRTQITVPGKMKGRSRGQSAHAHITVRHVPAMTTATAPAATSAPPAATATAPAATFAHLRAARPMPLRNLRAALPTRLQMDGICFCCGFGVAESREHHVICGLFSVRIMMVRVA